jgi:hypothetical protein
MLPRILIVLLASTPALAHAQRAPRTFTELAFHLVDLMGYAIGTLVLAGLVLYFAGALQHMAKTHRGDSKERSKFFLTGIIILFVMVSVWGILQILESTLFGTGQNLDFGSEGDSGFIQDFGVE